ncbi:hypothetical protein [Stenotrophomonas pavanii]|uniref:hypothetical protein n=1 Tax=Stenotrophomonas pavanii TaxID=487698 RepID=UPI002E7A09CF|nr:hypothetical protein [Stenotrophomonas pavanii]
MPSRDGVDAQTLAARRVGDFSGRWNVQATRMHDGGEVLLEQGNPFVPPLRTCTFCTNGREQAYALSWTPLDPATRKARLADTRRNLRPANGWRTMPDGGYWITTSSFNADPAAANFQERTRMMQQLAPAADALQQALLIVLDVRGKSGGASHWSIELARLIWGPAAVDALRD